MALNSKPKLDLDTLYSDLEKFADIAEVPFNSEAVHQILELFGDIYPEATISIRTTTQPKGKRDVNFRYMETQKSHNPFERLQKAGLIKLEGHPVEKIIPEVLSRYDVWWGIDVAVSHGFEKIWTFFEKGVPIDDILNLASLPTSARNYRDHFKKFAPDTACILAIDFWNKTMNIYPAIIPPGSYAPDKIAAMITDLGFDLPSEEELMRNSRSPNFYYTFSWDTPTVQRLCFVIPTPPEEFPIHWHPLCKQFVDHVPFQAERRMFAYNTTYGPRAGYLKIEADYVGTLEKIFSYWNN